MKPLRFALSSVVSIGLVACAAIPSNHDTVISKGVVSKITDLRNHNQSSTVFIPGVGGAAGLLLPNMSTRYLHYEITLSDGRSFSFPARDGVSLGECVDVLSEKSNIGRSTWRDGEVSLRQSMSCKSAAQLR
jgi:hypothetical protein